MRYYHALGRLISPALRLFFRIHTLIINTPRARVVVCNEFGEILLVRNWAGVQKWELPGGGVERSEAPEEAARRELLEETGIDAPVEDFQHIATTNNDYLAHIYAVTVAKNQLPEKLHNSWEITAISWHHPSKMPTDISELAKGAVKIVSKMS